MGGSALQLPTVSRPTDLTGEYKVPGPGNTYRASISSVSSTNYYYSWPDVSTIVPSASMIARSTNFAG